MTTLAAEDRIWIAVADAGAVGSARRAATTLAREIDLSEARTADLAIVTTELASNLYKHATDGVLLIRIVRRAGVAGIEIVATDKGPGMVDVAASARDGHSTAGTLGIGLGAVTRQSSEFDAYSLPGTGTVIVATMWPGEVPARGEFGGTIAALSRPMAGESVTGDGYGARESDGRLQVMLCDGLGHGPLAAIAAQAATVAFQAAPAGGPKAAIEHIHTGLSHTRGVVVTVVEFDLTRGQVRFAGLGNVAGFVVDGASRRMMLPQPGIAGHQRPKVRELDIPYPPSALVVLHSDGLNDRWRLEDYPGLATRAPVLVAAILLRDAGVRRDDAAVLVARASP